MSGYEYLTIETLPEQEIGQWILQLEARMFASNARIRAAVAAGDRDELAAASADHRDAALQIDALLAEQDRRAMLPTAVRAGEHPPELF